MNFAIVLTLLRMGGVVVVVVVVGRGGPKDPPTSFFLVTSKNVGISPQDSVTFIFKAFATLL